jgi:hypothetical protein
MDANAGHAFSQLSTLQNGGLCSLLQCPSSSTNAAVLFVQPAGSFGACMQCHGRSCAFVIRPIVCWGVDLYVMPTQADGGRALPCTWRAVLRLAEPNACCGPACHATQVAAVLEGEAEYGVPSWVFGAQTIAHLPGDFLLAICSDPKQPGGQLGLLDLSAAAPKLQPLRTPFTSFGGPGSCVRAAEVGRTMLVQNMMCSCSHSSWGVHSCSLHDA